ncbi:MAG TPA: ATP-binding protein [Terriglobales bacterium]
MPSQQPIRPSTRRRIIIVGSVVLVLVGIIFSTQAFNLTFLRPDTASQTLVLFALSTLIFVALVVLTFVLLRTLLKLYLERQSGVLGSKFRTKMVLGALLLSFAPVLALFLLSYGLMNRSIEKWFSRPMEEVREHTSDVTTLLAGYAGQNAVAEAQAIGDSTEGQKAFRSGNFGPMLDEIRRRQTTLQDGFVVVLYGDQLGASFRLPEDWATLRGKLQFNPMHVGKWHSFTMNGRDYVMGSAHSGPQGTVIVAMPLPQKYSETLRLLDNAEQKYLELRSERKMIRQTYMQMLLLVTLAVLFASTWSALTLSKLVTRPVSALAQATHEISEGRLDYRVDVAAGDELAELVTSFNSMAGELQHSRSEIEQSRHQLEEANAQLEQRRRSMETLLESIPSGVLSLDAQMAVRTVNPALMRMLRKSVPAGVSGPQRLADLFPPEVAEEIARMTRRADRMGTISAQMEFTSGMKLNVGVTVASMDARGTALADRMGYVVVFEDLSDLLRAQTQAAWREVARRVAHEIKNPLTPITLGAERILRHLQRGANDEGARWVIEQCAETIASSAETVRALVDEFSALARFPQSTPVPSDLNHILETALAMFDGRLTGIRVDKTLAPELPPVLADPEAIKRVIANLIDNAAEAMRESLVREISITTSELDTRDAVELIVADTGHGITPEMKERLFTPYYTTKQHGTGLGLAIVSRIVEEHHGTIRVEENKPVGTRFIVELPVAAESASSQAQSGS